MVIVWENIRNSRGCPLRDSEANVYKNGFIAISRENGLRLKGCVNVSFGIQGENKYLALSEGTPYYGRKINYKGKHGLGEICIAVLKDEIKPGRYKCIWKGKILIIKLSEISIETMPDLPSQIMKSEKEFKKGR